MPGICGFYSTDPQPDAAALADSMTARLRASNCPIVSRHLDKSGRFALGRVSLGVLPSSPQPACWPESRLQAVMDGELYEMDKLCSDLPLHGHRVDHDDHATVLLANYARGGVEGIAALEGSFAAAIVDAAGQTLSVVTDRFGTRPIYYAHTGNRLSFASNISCLLADPEISREFDWQGLSQFFTLGHYFNDNTSLAAVKLIPAGAVLVFERARKSSIAATILE